MTSTMDVTSLLVWDNMIMGLRVETRIDDVLIQTNFGMVIGRTVRGESGTTLRYGLKVL